MKVLLLSVALVALVGLGEAQKTFTCYWEAWNRARVPVDSIPVDKCDRVIYSFAGLDWSTWKITSLDQAFDIQQGGFNQLVALKKKNPALKVTVAIGGWGEGVQKYSDMVAVASRRKIFVDSVMDWMNKYQFDGLDIDWEYPADTSRNGNLNDKANLNLLLKELRDALGPNRLLTIAVFSTTRVLVPGYDVPTVAKYCDYIHIMTYDLRGSWDNRLGNHVSLYPSSRDSGDFAKLTVSQGMKNWENAGCPKHKLIMGFAFYGKGFNKAGGNNQGDASAGDAGTPRYAEICQKLKQGFTRVFDSETKVPYAYNGNQWIGYEDPEGIRYKTDLIKKEGYGGAMTWAITQDDMNNECGQGRFPLATAIVNGLKGESSDDNKHPTPAPSPTPTTTTRRPSPNPVADCSSGAEYLPHTTFCGKYFRCVHGSPVEMSCSNGLIFDNSQNICNWPTAVSNKLPAGCTDA